MRKKFKKNGASSSTLNNKMISGLLWSKKNKDKPRENLSIDEVENFIDKMEKSEKSQKASKDLHAMAAYDLANVYETLCKSSREHKLNDLTWLNVFKILKHFLVSVIYFNKNEAGYCFDEHKASQDIFNFLIIKLETESTKDNYSNLLQLLSKFELSVCKKWVLQNNQNKKLIDQVHLNDSDKPALLNKKLNKRKYSSTKSELKNPEKKSKLKKELNYVASKKKVKSKPKYNELDKYFFHEYSKLKASYISFDNLSYHLSDLLDDYVNDSKTPSKETCHEKILYKKGLETIFKIFITNFNEIKDDKEKNIILRFWGRLSFLYSIVEIENFANKNQVWLQQHLLAISIFPEFPKFTFIDSDLPLLMIPTDEMFRCVGFFCEETEINIAGDSSQRIKTATQAILSIPFDNLKNIQILNDRMPITDHEINQAIQLVHSEIQITYLKDKAALSKKLGIPIGIDGCGDTLVDEFSFKAAFQGVKQTVFAAKQITRGKAPYIAFCIGRPPGHHADEKFHGFCLFNKVAVTAAFMSQQGEKVLIVDIDAHYADGTISLIQKRAELNNVRIINSFNKNIFPFSKDDPTAKSIQSIREDSQHIAIRNVPYHSKSNSDQILKSVIEEKNKLIKEGFFPTLVIFSYGLDGHEDDPLGNSKLTTDFYTDVLEDFAIIGVPILISLEGGYNKSVIEKVTKNTVLALPKLSCLIKEKSISKETLTTQATVRLESNEIKDLPIRNPGNLNKKQILPSGMKLEVSNLSKIPSIKQVAKALMMPPVQKEIPKKTGGNQLEQRVEVSI